MQALRKKLKKIKMNKEKELDKDLKAAEIKKDRALEKDPDVFKQIKIGLGYRKDQGLAILKNKFNVIKKSIAINEVKKEYVATSLTAERICPTAHSAEINKIFFETIEEMDCYYDPLSILR